MSFSAPVVESNFSVQLILILERYQNTIVLRIVTFKNCDLKTHMLEGSCCLMLFCGRKKVGG